MFDRLGELAAEHAELERTLADPAVHADPERARALSRRYGEITPVVEAYHAVAADVAPTRPPPGSWPARTRRSRPRPSSWAAAGPSSRTS